MTSSKPSYSSLALRWYRNHARDLPWRTTHDPYRIWISEIMLQQTQVATVLPYYERFLNRFPNVSELAGAGIDEVFSYWAGLGYYRRAKQLHAAAQKVVADHQAEFPSSFAEVLALPGIGRYTAGAILSFAFDQRLPIVEANTQRLYARLLYLKEPPASAKGQAALWQFAEDILPKKNSGHVNQAMMEIGSQVCTPKSPNCNECPFFELCPTRKRNAADKIPVPKKAIQFTELSEGLLVLRNERNEVLLRKCQPGERWAGLWDFPRFDTTEAIERNVELSKFLGDEFKKRFCVSIRVGSKFHSLRHGVTRYKIVLECFDATIVRGSGSRLCDADNELRWVQLEPETSVGLNSSAKKVWLWIQKHQIDSPDLIRDRKLKK